MARTRAPWARWVPARYGGSPMGGGGRKIVLHTMECGSEHQPCWPGYGNWGSTPHLSVHPGSGQARQHVLFDRSARALASPGHPHSPNMSTFAIQIEIVGRAHDTPRYGDDWYRQLAEWVGWLCDEWDIPKRFPFDFGEAGTAGRNGKNRVSWDAYYHASGIVGHQNVPYNDHWDPGNLNQARLLRYMGGGHDTKDWFDMADIGDLKRAVREEVSDDLDAIRRELKDLQDEQRKTARLVRGMPTAFARIRKMYRNLVEIPYGHMPEGSDNPTADPVDPGYDDK